MNNTTKNNRPYRPGVGLFILNKNKQVFIGKRIDIENEYWQMPQGGIDDGESPEEAAYRELQEETGIKNANIIACTKNWLHYDLPLDLSYEFWDGKFTGQKQLWFLLEFSGKDSEIDITQPEPEFSSWKWTNIQNLPNIVVPFKKNLYIEVIEEFRQYLNI